MSVIKLPTVKRPSNSPRFHIIEAYAALDKNRRMLLYDRLFSDSYDSFCSLIHLYWPEATAKDEQKLEKFLILLRNTSL